MSNLGNKEIISKNIRHYMELYGKNRMELCQALGVKYTTLTDWINGNSYPRIDKIELMANYFGVGKADLIEERGTVSDRGVKIPVLGQVAAGVPISAVEDILDYEEIPATWKTQGEFFALKIKGDSMEPRMISGDVVIVRQQSTAESGDTVVVLVNGDSATCKRLEKTDSGIMLVSTNIKYPPLFFTPKEVDSLPVTILGKVVELRQKY